jgi:hypothetical protein
MTSLKQIEANRRNALKSTGPRSEEGKHRSSRNALRHGLTAETVIEPLEDQEDYKLFEQAIAAEYDAESAVERELVLRLASLLWRLRRATSIEAMLFEVVADPRRESEAARVAKPKPGVTSFSSVFRLSKETTCPLSDELWTARAAAWSGHDDMSNRSRNTQREIARRYLRLAELDSGLLERLNRYELALWRQARQTLFTLELLRWRSRRTAAYARSELRWRTKEINDE